MNKNIARIRRSRQTRLKISQLAVSRLAVHRTNSHIYANVFSPCGTRVVASASTAEVGIKKQLSTMTGKGGNKLAATLVGKIIAEKAKAAGVSSVAFDRSGFRYHGRVRALADAAREAGLSF